MRRRAFTLVEILIVVVILGILAAISIPQFASATSNAQATSTYDALQKVRRAINVYRVRHGGALPPIAAGAGTEVDPVSGQSVVWGELVGESGDYMLGLPVNQWVGGANARRVVIVPNALADVAYQTDYGWIYDPINGEVWAGGFDIHDEPLDRP